MNKETVFLAVSEIKVKTALYLLKESGINAHMINKMDTAHPNVFGEIQIIVGKDDASNAQKILKQAEIL